MIEIERIVKIKTHPKCFNVFTIKGWLITTPNSTVIMNEISQFLT